MTFSPEPCPDRCGKPRGRTGGVCPHGHTAIIEIDPPRPDGGVPTREYIPYCCKRCRPPEDDGESRLVHEYVDYWDAHKSAPAGGDSVPVDPHQELRDEETRKAHEAWTRDHTCAACGQLSPQVATLLDVGPKVILCWPHHAAWRAYVRALVEERLGPWLEQQRTTAAPADEKT